MPFIVIAAILGVIGYRAIQHNTAVNKTSAPNLQRAISLGSNRSKRVVANQPPSWAKGPSGSGFILRNPDIGTYNSGGNAIVASGGPATVPMTGTSGTGGTAVGGVSGIKAGTSSGGGISRTSFGSLQS